MTKVDRSGGQADGEVFSAGHRPIYPERTDPFTPKGNAVNDFLPQESR